MTLAQADQILDRGDDSFPPRAVVDQKSPGQIGFKLPVLAQKLLWVILNNFSSSGKCYFLFFLFIILFHSLFFCRFLLVYRFALCFALREKLLRFFQFKGRRDHFNSILHGWERICPPYMLFITILEIMAL